MMNQSKWTVALAVAAVLYFSCQPAKQLQKENQDIQALKAEWIAEWVKDHPCPLIPPVNLDSLCGVNDFAFDMQSKDTGRTQTIAGATKSRDTVILVRRILVPYQDTRAVDLLYDSLRTQTERAAMLQNRQDVQVRDCAGQVTAIQKQRDKWFWLFIAACVVNAIGLIWKLYTFFSGIITKL